jgi:sulfonate transport system substrate-binding protein
LLAKSGVRVRWAEFAAGPPLLEAMNAGAIDLGSTGEAPPILAQAAGAPIVYIANEPPAPRGEAILVPTNSPVTSVADLRGKRIALNRGSNVHYLLVRALAAASVPYPAITPVWLAPSEARAAFVRGDVDAWAIWDPFFASAEAHGAKILGDATNTVPNHSFYLSRRDFATAHADALNAAIDSVKQIEAWLPANLPAAAAEISPIIGLPAPIVLTSLQRQKYGVVKVSPAVLADQQKIADLFYKLNLIPSPIKVSDAAWG